MSSFFSIQINSKDSRVELADQEVILVLKAIETKK